MAQITFRDTVVGKYTGKGSELTFREADDNLYNLNEELKLKSSKSFSKILVGGSLQIQASIAEDQVNLVAGSGINILPGPNNTITLSAQGVGSIGLISDNSNTVNHILFAQGLGNQSIKIDDTTTPLTYNPSTSTLTTSQIVIRDQATVNSLVSTGAVQLYDSTTATVSVANSTTNVSAFNAANTINIGNSSGAQNVSLFASASGISTYNIATGPTTNKTVNLGTGSVNTTAINIGGALGVTAINSQITTVNTVRLAGNIETTSSSFQLAITGAQTAQAFSQSTSLRIGYDGTDNSSTIIAGGITAASRTKTVQIASNGSAGSTTNVIIGDQQGGSTTVNSPSLNAQSFISTGPVFRVGSASAEINTSRLLIGEDVNDTAARGILYRWNNGTSKLGFFGYQASTGFLTFVPDASVQNGTIQGSTGVIDVQRITGSAARLTTARTITLQGDVTGSISFDGSSNVIISTRVESVAAAVPGGYVKSVSVNGSGISIVGGTGPANDAVISIASSSQNVANTLIFRDATGSFAAQNITAQQFIGNASTATTWATPRNISLTGDATANINGLNGSSNITTAITLSNVNSNVGTFGDDITIPVITVNAKGLTTAVTTRTVPVGINIIDENTDAVRYLTFTSLTGGNTRNLNIDSSVTALTYNPNNNTISSNITGNAPTSTTSTRWANSRQISFNGDVSGTITAIDGSQNVSAALTLASVNSTVGTFGSSTAIPVITVNAKGLVTSVSTQALTTVQNANRATSAQTIDVGSKSDAVDYPLVFSDQTGSIRSLYTDSAGGTYNPATNQANINIIGNANTATRASSIDTQLVTDAGSYNIAVMSSASSQTAKYVSTVTIMANTGDLVSQGNITAFSDEKLKKNVTTIQQGLQKIRLLRGVSYDRIDTERAEIGLIAQEVQKILPEVVIDCNGTLSVAYQNIVSVLIEAVKELSGYTEEEAYLKSTDWYVIRKIETGEDIPVDIAEKRKKAREVLNAKAG